MKRKFKSAAELNRVALQTGAAVELGGRRFNTGMERAQPEPTTPPPPPVSVAAPVDVAPPAPAPEQRIDEQVHLNIDMSPVATAISDGNRQVMDQIQKSLKTIEVKAPEGKPCSWIFSIKRDTRGFIESVEAQPKL